MKSLLKYDLERPVLRRLRLYGEFSFWLLILPFAALATFGMAIAFELSRLAERGLFACRGLFSYDDMSSEKHEREKSSSSKRLKNYLIAK